MEQAVKTPQAPAPAQAQAPGATVVTTGQLTAADVAALRQRKSILTDQIGSAQGRRSEIRRSLQSATGVDQAGLEQQMTIVNTRIARLETDIDENGKQLSSLEAIKASGVTVQPPPGSYSPQDRVGRNMNPIGVVFTLFVLAPMAFSLARIFWKRGSLAPTARGDTEQRQRLERMEQAIDSIAIEVERVSEGQRFVTRILAEGAGAPAVGVPQREKLQVPR